MIAPAVAFYDGTPVHLVTHRGGTLQIARRPVDPAPPLHRWDGWS